MSDRVEAAGSAQEPEPAPAAAAWVEPGRLAVWREVLGPGWIGLSVVLAATSAAARWLGWTLPGTAPPVGASGPLLVLVLAALLAGLLEGSHRAVARRERKIAEKREEIERLFRTPLRRLVQAKYELYRDSFMCSQLIGFLTMARMEASAMTADTALRIEQCWGSEFHARFQRIFGAGKLGDAFSQRIGGMIPPPRERAMSTYAGLADFLQLLAERITESDLDPDYLHGRDAPREPEERSGAATDAAGGEALPADGTHP